MIRALIAVSVALLTLRFYAASIVGFGDSEALYATWAAHPQPAYLDHPGLVGVVARAIGEGAVPTASRTHLVTAVIATIVPWLVFVAGRAVGGAPRRAAIAALVVALVPEIAVGLFALTPDLLLAPAWLGAIALAAHGLRAEPGSTRAAASLVGAGVLAGAAGAAKVSGLLLVVALAVTYASVARTRTDAGRIAKSIWPWAGLAAGLVVIVPVVMYEARLGLPMLRHRLVDTQHGAGVALANLGSLFGGQLLYLSPVVAWLVVALARDLVARRAADVTTRLLFYTSAVPLLPLVVLSIWSPVAEPHWVAPAFLALAVHAALPPATKGKGFVASRRLLIAGAAFAAAFTVLAHAWVLIPSSARLLPRDADPKLDIASELYGWPFVLDSVREQMKNAATPTDPEGREVVLVGPHWVVCAQLHAAMPGVRAGCATPIKDDFDGWLPRDDWRKAHDVLFVTDNRFGGDGAEQLPLHVPVRGGHQRVTVMRGGRPGRVFDLYLYTRQASSERAASDPDRLALLGFGSSLERARTRRHRGEPSVPDEREILFFAGVRRGE